MNVPILTKLRVEVSQPGNNDDRCKFLPVNKAGELQNQTVRDLHRLSALRKVLKFQKMFPFHSDAVTYGANKVKVDA